MKFTVIKTIKEEIDLPKYWQSGSCYHALLDGEYALEINIDNPSIKRVYISTATVCGVEEISEEDFNLRLNEIKLILNL
jgi:hypothetical protein